MYVGTYTHSSYSSGTLKKKKKTNNFEPLLYASHFVGASWGER